MTMQAEIAPPRKYDVGQYDFDPEVGRRLRILVDGVEQKNVIAFDCDAGTVEKFKLGEDGLIMLNVKRDEAVRETLRGDVAVEWAR